MNKLNASPLPKNELNITRNGKQRTRNRKKELKVNQ